MSLALLVIQHTHHPTESFNVKSHTHKYKERMHLFISQVVYPQVLLRVPVGHTFARVRGTLKDAFMSCVRVIVLVLSPRFRRQSQ